MRQTDRVFTGSIPALYDHHLGPLIFEPYAVDLADRLARMTEGDVLETAAGMGIVTRALARTLAPEIRITATDLNQPMLDFAAAQSARAGTATSTPRHWSGMTGPRTSMCLPSYPARSLR